MSSALTMIKKNEKTRNTQTTKMLRIKVKKSITKLIDLTIVTENIPLTI